MPRVFLLATVVCAAVSIVGCNPGSPPPDRATEAAVRDVVDDTAIHIVGSAGDIGELGRTTCSHGLKTGGVILSRRLYGIIGRDEDVVRQAVADYWSARFGSSAEFLRVDTGRIRYEAVYATDSPGLLLVGYTDDCPRPDLYR